MNILKLLCVIMTVLFLTGVWWGGSKDEEYLRYG